MWNAAPPPPSDHAIYNRLHRVCELRGEMENVPEWLKHITADRVDIGRPLPFVTDGSTNW